MYIYIYICNCTYIYIYTYSQHIAIVDLVYSTQNVWQRHVRAEPSGAPTESTAVQVDLEKHPWNHHGKDMVSIWLVNG